MKSPVTLAVSLALASMCVLACGDPHPRSAVVYPEDGDARTPIVVSGTSSKGGGGGAGADESAPSSPAGDDAANEGAPGAMSGGEGGECDGESLHLLGSCAPYDDGLTFDGGAHCVEHWDKNPDASTKDLEYACECSKALWSTMPCSKRVVSESCTMESSPGCSRSVVCFPKTQ